MKKIFLLAAATIALAACSDDYDRPVEVKVYATIGENALTRASSTTWDLNDAIGVYMDTYLTTTEEDNSKEATYVNIKYITEAGNGEFKSDTTMYFKNKRIPVDIYGYYPYTGEEHVKPGPIEYSTVSEKQTPEEQKKFDFLFDKKVRVLGKDNPRVNFVFEHKMSKITLIFKNGDGADVSKIKSYEIEGLVLDGTFDTTTGICSTKSDATAQTLSMTPTNVVSGKELPSLIVFPQVPGEVMLTIVDGDNQWYKSVLTFEDNELKCGNEYQFTVRVNKTAVVVDKAEIKEWNKVENETGASSFYPEN